MFGAKIHHNKKLFWIIIILLVLLIAVLIDIRIIETKQKLNKNNQNSSLDCIKDTDCVKKQVTCCPCNSGGREECVNKSNQTEVNCSKNQLVCAQVYNCRETSCICENNKCLEK